MQVSESNPYCISPDVAWQSGSGQLRSDGFRTDNWYNGVPGLRNHPSKYIGGIKTKPPVNIRIADIAFEHGGTQEQQSFNWKSGEYKDLRLDGTIAVWKVTLQLLKLTHHQKTQDTQDENNTSDRQKAKDKQVRDEEEQTYQNNKYFADQRYAEKKRLRDKTFKEEQEKMAEEHRLTYEKEKLEEHHAAFMKNHRNASQKQKESEAHQTLREMEQDEKKKKDDWERQHALRNSRGRGHAVYHANRTRIYGNSKPPPPQNPPTKSYRPLVQERFPFPDPHQSMIEDQENEWAQIDPDASKSPSALYDAKTHDEQHGLADPTDVEVEADQSLSSDEESGAVVDSRPQLEQQKEDDLKQALDQKDNDGTSPRDV